MIAEIAEMKAAGAKQPISPIAAANRPVPEIVLDMRRLTKDYATRSGAEVRALDNVSLALEGGEFVSVVGPSGCGKTTLLKIVAGIAAPSAGEIQFRGRPVKGPQDGFGVVFQSSVLLPWLKIIDNVLLPTRVLGQDRKVARQRGLELLELVGLGDFAEKYPNELSGGMQQRASIVRALVHDPRVLFMDEPFGALDALTRDHMNVELQRIWLKSGKTVFFITHSIPEAVFLSDRVIVMTARPGRIVREFRIDFPRPRALDLTGTSEFGEYTKEIRHLLEPEERI